MKDNFILYTKYEEQISLLSDAQAGVLLRALMCYQSEKTLPQMDGMTNMIFTVIRQQIDFDNQKYDDICETRRNAGAQGGRPSKSLTNKGNKPKKPNGFESEEEKPNGFEKKQTKAKKPESDTDTDTDNNTPLFIPPTGDKKTEEDLFFEKYPRYEKDKAKMRTDVDYTRLIAEFEKSQYLRNLYTVKQINELYPLIIGGDFRDKDKTEKPKDERTEAANARADRERWYADRKAKAEKKADEIRKRFMQNEEFAKIEKRLKVLPIEQAKAEVKGDVSTLVKLEQEKNRLTLQRRGIIELNGMSEEELLPQWHCRKCKDTGYTADGKMCDCYAKEK